MANSKHSVGFKKGILHFEDNKIIFEEITKDGSLNYDLTKALKEFENIQNVNITIGNDEDIEPIME
jgi:hypothetical protein